MKEEKNNLLADNNEDKSTGVLEKNVKDGIRDRN